MNDDRLDQLIHDALAWQADEVAAAQPSLGTAMQRLAERVPPATVVSRPRVVFLPNARPVNPVAFVLLLLLLLTLLATGIVVGALLLQRISPDIRPGPFGLASACQVEHSAGVALEVSTDIVDDAGHFADVTRLYVSGSLVRDLSVPGETRASAVRGARYTERRLHPRGRALVFDRLADAGLGPGCRWLRTSRSSGRITAATPVGSMQAFWGPDAGARALARLLTPEEEAELTALSHALAHPGSWLPEDAWMDPAERQIVPDNWLVTATLRPTDMIPGPGLTLPNGIFLDGSDPRYARVVLPDGAELATFGDELPFRGLSGPGSVHRCGVVDRRAALLLADSLDALELNEDGSDLFTEDLSMEISISIRPAYPEGDDCQVVIDQRRAQEAPLPTFVPPEPVGDLAHIDPCTLVPDDGDVLRRIGVENLVAEPSPLAMAPTGRACGLFDTDGNMSETMGRHGYRRATLTLYPESVEQQTAGDVAMDILGDSARASSVSGLPTWENDCLTQDLPCVRAIAAWSKAKLVVIVFDSTGRTQGHERPLIEEVLGVLQDRYP